MVTFLLATTSIHTTATACDYLQTRLDDDDTVMVLGVEDPQTPDRDIDDAVNVARARLAPATVWTERRTGTPANEIHELADDIEADEILVGRRRGAPEKRGNPGLGSTASAVAGEADRPVIVLPL